jgi:hypothetical protein
MNENLEFLSDQIYEHIKLVLKSKPEYLSFIKNTDYIKGLTILFRFVNSRVVPWQKQKVTLTNEFNQDLAKITDKRIKKKIDDLITALSCGDPILNDTSLDIEHSFAPRSMDKFFKKGDYCCDFLLEQFGIQHYHVGYDANTDKTLVYVWRDWQTEQNILLGIGNHDDILMQSKSNHIRDSMFKIFPEEILGKYFYKTPFPPEDSVLNDKEFKTLRNRGINTSFVDSVTENVFMSPSYSTSKTPVYIFFFLRQLMADIPLLLKDIGARKLVGLNIKPDIALISATAEDGKISHLEVNLDDPDVKRSSIGKLLLAFRSVRLILDCF